MTARDVFRFVSLLFALWGVAGCGADLGKCDMQLLGDGSTPSEGQQILNNTCANGRCHSATAEGSNRFGVPKGLDFDVIPSIDLGDPSTMAQTADQLAEAQKVTRGGGNVRDEAEELWGEIDEGAMPPEGQGTLLPEQKEKVRNWLACNAPVVAEPVQSVQTADWMMIFQSLNTQCTACHSVQAGPSSGNGFTLGDDACSAYANVVDAPAVTTLGMCAGTGTLVVGGMPLSSILLQKLLPPAPAGAVDPWAEVRGTRCGGAMPFGTQGLTDQQLLANIRDWIQAGAPKPASCP